MENLLNISVEEMEDIEQEQPSPIPSSQDTIMYNTQQFQASETSQLQPSQPSQASLPSQVSVPSQASLPSQASQPPKPPLLQGQEPKQDTICDRLQNDPTATHHRTKAAVPAVEAGEDEERDGIMEGTMEGSGKVLQAIMEGGSVDVHGATAPNAAPTGMKKTQLRVAILGPVVNVVPQVPEIKTSISKPQLQ